MIYIKKNRLQRLVMDLLLLSSVFSFLITFIAILSKSRYQNIWIWPLCFLFFLIMNYNRYSIIKKSHYLGLTLVVFVELFPRYVLYPLVVSLSGLNYIGVFHFSMSGKELTKGIYLGAIEIIGLMMFVFIVERIKKEKIREKKEKELKLSGNQYIYLIYFLISLGVYFAIGRKLNIIQFLTMNSGYSRISSNIYLTLVKYIISIGLSIFTLLIINYEKIKYRKTSNNIYVFIAALISMIYTGFIVGESRATQVGIGLLMLIILVEEFPKQRAFISIGMVISIMIVVTSITVFRTGNMFSVGNSFEELADKLQVYIGGPGSISQSVNVLGDNSDISFGKFIFDFIRSCFPFNLILKNSDYTTSQIYNLLLYGGRYTHGHIVFGASYGYIFFGVFGIPLTICLNYYLIIKANEVFYYTSSYEVKYVSGYCLIRLVAAFLVNTPTILGSVTQFIGTYGLLIFLSNHIKKRAVYISEEYV